MQCEPRQDIPHDLVTVGFVEQLMPRLRIEPHGQILNPGPTELLFDSGDPFAVVADRIHTARNQQHRQLRVERPIPQMGVAVILQGQLIQIGGSGEREVAQRVILIGFYHLLVPA